jgi:G:T-mismatch repair DNA endonuclease (very short patch repair protein)
LAERYEITMARFAQITQAGYKVEVKWECDFYEGILADQPEMKTPHSTARAAEH